MSAGDPRDADPIVQLDAGDLLDTLDKFRDGRMSRRRFMTRTAAMGLSLASITALMAAAGPVAGSSRRTGRAGAALVDDQLPMVGFNQPYLAAQVTIPLYDGARAAAQRRGYQLLESAVQDAKLDQQLAEVNQWIALGVQGMTILPIDPNAFGPIVTKAHEAGVKSVGGYDGHIPGEDTWLGFDHAQGAGEVASRATFYIQSDLGGACNIAGLVAKNLPQSKLRVDDCIQLILDMNPNAVLVATEEATLAAEALAATQALLQAHPEIQMIICLADDGTIGAAQAVKLAGKQPTDVWLAGYDGAKQALTMLKDGEIMGAIAGLPLTLIGETAVDLPANVIEGKEPNIALIPYTVVGNGDIEAIDELLAAYGA